MVKCDQCGEDVESLEDHCLEWHTYSDPEEVEISDPEEEEENEEEENEEEEHEVQCIQCGDYVDVEEYEHHWECFHKYKEEDAADIEEDAADAVKEPDLKKRKTDEGKGLSSDNDGDGDGEGAKNGKKDEGEDDD